MGLQSQVDMLIMLYIKPLNEQQTLHIAKQLNKPNG
jgi:hypothetical protein